MSGSVIGCLYEKLAEQLAKESSPTAVAKAEKGYLSKKKVAELEKLIKDATDAADDGLTGDVNAAKKVLATYESRLLSRANGVTRQIELNQAARDHVLNAMDRGASLAEARASISFNAPSERVNHGASIVPVESSIAGHKANLMSVVRQGIDQLLPEHWFSKVDPVIDGAMWDDLFAAVHGTPRKADKNMQAFTDQVVHLYNDMIPKMLRDKGVDLPHQLSNYLGGAHPKLDKILRVSKEQYADEMLSLNLNWNKVGDVVGPEKIATIGQKRTFLHEHYRTVVSGGITKLSDFDKIGGMKGLKSLVNGHNSHRLLEFNDARSAQAFAHKFGDDNFLNVIASAIDRSSRELGTLDRYGSRPEVFKNQLARDLADSGKIPLEQLSEQMKAMERDMSYYMGSGGSGINPKYTSASQFATSAGRALLLGGHVIGALFGDLMTLGPLSRHMQGIDMFKGGLKMYLPTNTAGRKQMKEVLGAMGYWHGVQSDALSAAAESTEQQMLRLAKGAARAVEQVSINKAITDAGRGVNATSFMMALGSMAEHGMTSESEQKMLGHLFAGDGTNAGNFMGMLKSYGISKEDISHAFEVGKTSVSVDGGKTTHNVIDLGSLYRTGNAADQDIAVKIAAAANDLVSMGSPQSNPQMAKIFKELKDTGSIPGQIVGSMGLFQGYMADLWRQTFKVALSNPSKWRAGAMVAGWATALTMTGILQQQVRNLLWGKDLQPMDGNLLFKGFVTGGAAPVVGNMLSQTQGGVLDQFSAATVPVTNILKFVKDNAARAYKGKETHLLADGARVLNSLMPGQNLPAIGLVFRRMMEQVMKGVDPSYSDKRFKSQISRARTDGQSFWWAPGELKPQHLPGLPKK